MKKLLVSVILVLGIAFATHAQGTVSAMTNPNGFALDTVTNAVAEGPMLKTAGFGDGVSIVVVLTKISGVVAGNIQWQGSNDGVNFATISSSALSDASGNFMFSEAPKRFLYYKANVAGTGTMSASYKATIYVTVKGR
jgi:hypothetical protein